MSAVMKRCRSLPLVVVLLLAPVLHATERPRPEHWAKPVTGTHLRNFHQLDKKVYRSAQPDSKGFKDLLPLGITTVLSFRTYRSDVNSARGTGLKLYRIKMEAGDIQTGHVVQALKIIKDAPGPILIHCWHGADRTGLISAMYRIVFQGWSKEEAIDELVSGGYGYHALYRNILEYIAQADIEAIKKQVTAPQVRKPAMKKATKQVR